MNLSVQSLAALIFRIDALRDSSEVARLAAMTIPQTRVSEKNTEIESPLKSILISTKQENIGREIRLSIPLIRSLSSSL